MSIFKKENGALVEYTNPLPADYVAPIEDGATSAHDYAVGAFALVKGVFRKITTAVTSGTAITNANSEITTVAEQLEEINTDLSELLRWKVLGNPITGSNITPIDIPNDCSELLVSIFAGNTNFNIVVPVNMLTDSLKFFQSPGGYANNTYQAYVRFTLSKSQYGLDGSNCSIGSAPYQSTAVTTIYYR